MPGKEGRSAQPRLPAECPIKAICQQMIASRRTGSLETGFVRSIEDAARNKELADKMLHCTGVNQRETEPDKMCQIDPFGTRHLNHDLRYQISVAQEPISDINL